MGTDFSYSYLVVECIGQLPLLGKNIHDIADHTTTHIVFFINVILTGRQHQQSCSSAVPCNSEHTKNSYTKLIIHTLKLINYITKRFLNNYT